MIVLVGICFVAFAAMFSAGDARVATDRGPHRAGGDLLSAAVPRGSQVSAPAFVAERALGMDVTVEGLETAEYVERMRAPRRAIDK
jgi:hypothetical protein